MHECVTLFTFGRTLVSHTTSCLIFFFFFSSRRRHTRLQGDWSSDVCSSDLLESDALREVSSRHPELSPEEQSATAHDIAVGALKYFLLKFTRNSVIAFD